MTDDVPTFAVPSGFLGIDRRDRDAAIAIAGIPLDIGTTNRSGARFGPHAIRRASRMLVDGDHPTAWTDLSAVSLADIGDFRIALGDIQKSLALIEEQAAAIGHLIALGGEHGVTLPLCGRWRAASGRSVSSISMPMWTPGRTISARPSPMDRSSSMPSTSAWSIRGA